MKKLKEWWTRSTLNEKLMYSLLLILLIGIATRWRYVFDEVGDAFSRVFHIEQAVTPSPKQPIIDLPELPVMMQGSAEAPAWLSEHFWDKANFADTSFLAYPSVIENTMKDFGMLLRNVEDSVVARAVKTLMQKASVNNDVLRLVQNKAEWTFYDPNSPVRNYEAHIAALQWVVGSPLFDQTEKIRPAAQLEAALKNRKGTKANNFAYVTVDGHPGNMYAAKTKYTLVFINNPGCPACRDYSELLSGSDIVKNLLATHQLTVLGVYPDKDEKAWRDYTSHFPKDWINGFDAGQTIRQAQSYELNVIPTLYLLDQNKMVLLKDARPDEVEQYLLNHE